MYKYTYACIYIYIYTQTTCVYIYIHIYMHACMYKRIHVWVCIYIYIFTCTHIAPQVIWRCDTNAPFRRTPPKRPWRQSFRRGARCPLGPSVSWCKMPWHGSLRPNKLCREKANWVGFWGNHVEKHIQKKRHSWVLKSLFWRKPHITTISASVDTSQFGVNDTIIPLSRRV